MYSSKKKSYLSSIAQPKNAEIFLLKKTKINNENPINSLKTHSSYVKGILSKAKLLMDNIRKRKKRNLSEIAITQSEHDQIDQTKDQINQLVNQFSQQENKNPNNISQMIQEKINHSAEKNKTPIIIINHDSNPKFPVQNNQPKTDQNGNLIEQINQEEHIIKTDIPGLEEVKYQPVPLKDPYYVQYPFNNGIDHMYNSIKVENAEVVSFKDIDTLLDVLNFVGHLYTDIFNSLPQEPEGKEKGGLEKTLDVLRFYSKVRNFLMVVIQSRQQLIEDINFLEGKVHALKTEREEMINFYGLDHKYFKVKLKMIRYSNDDKFKSYMNDLDTIQATFEKDVKTILKFAYIFGNQTATFIKEINDLQRNESSNNVLNALDKFDKIIMMTIRLIEVKISLEDSMENLKVSLNNLKTNKLALTETLNNIAKIGAKEVDLKTAPLESEFGYILSVCTTFLLIFVL